MTLPMEQVGRIEDLVERASLAEVRVYEFGARATAPASENPGYPSFDLEYSQRTEPDELEDRFRFVVRTEDAEYLYEASAIYRLQDAMQIPLPIRIDFAERIGFMVVFPYLRESLTTHAARLNRRGPLLDFMRPGDFKIEWEPAGAEPPAEQASD